MRFHVCIILAAVTLTSQAQAQSTITRDQPAHLIESYRAFIGRDDVRNSNGERLDQPWQVIRQDRANYHLYHVRDPGDEGDSFFASKTNRANLEQMLAHGSITGDAARALVDGNVNIQVDIYGHGNVGEYVDVHVQD